MLGKQTGTRAFYDKWHHEGHIEVEHSDDFYFTLDGRLYKVTLEDKGSEGCAIDG